MLRALPLFSLASLSLALLALGCTARSEAPVDAGLDAPRPYDAGIDARAAGDAGPGDAGPGDDADVADGSADAGEGIDDAGSDPDAGSVGDAGSLGDAALDAGSADAGTSTGDAGPDAGAAPDAGRPAPIVDGTLAIGEWIGAAVAADATVTSWTGNELRSLRALVRAEGLYVAVEGRIESGNALAIYVDRARGESPGVSLASLTDSSGALDAALTAALTTPADVLPDLAWGTLDLSRVAAATDDRMGWRDLGRGTASDLHWITDAESACGATSCETFLPRAHLDLGVTGARTIAVFARITNHDGTMSPNQTLPTDDPSMPRIVMQLLELAD